MKIPHAKAIAIDIALPILRPLSTKGAAISENVRNETSDRSEIIKSVTAVQSSQLFPERRHPT